MTHHGASRCAAYSVLQSGETQPPNLSSRPSGCGLPQPEAERSLFGVAFCLPRLPSGLEEVAGPTLNCRL